MHINGNDIGIGHVKSETADSVLEWNFHFRIEESFTTTARKSILEGLFLDL